MDGLWDPGVAAPGTSGDPWAAKSRGITKAGNVSAGTTHRLPEAGGSKGSRLLLVAGASCTPDRGQHS